MTEPWLHDVAWRRAITIDDRSFRWGLLGADYVAEWTGVLVVRADPTGSVKVMLPHPGAPDRVVEKVTKGEAAAFLRSIHGKLSLHASAVARADRALIFTGSSGAGKSTMAARLCDFLGASLLADDVAGLDMSHGALRVEPSEESVWLDNGTGGKAPVRTRVARRPTDLAAIVVLSFDDTLRAPELRPVRGSAIVTRMLDALLRFDLVPALWNREFELFAGLAAGARVFDLARPRTASVEDTASLVSSLVQQ